MNERKYLYALLKTLFKFGGQPFEAYEYQLNICEPIFFKKHNRFIITATTRAGKSMIIALLTLVYALRNPNKRIRIIAPTVEQSRVIMNYIIEHIADHSWLLNMLPLNSNDLKKGTERLQQQLSKTRMTFKNNTEIMIFSANGDANRLLGFGGDLVIVDESPLVSDDTYKSKIMRMLENDDSVLVQIGNPVKLNHFFNDWNDPRHHKIKINWRDCVREGRFSRNFIEEKALDLGGYNSPIFKVMYEAEFVEDATNNLIPFSAIDESVNRKLPDMDKGYIEMGVDVARFGVDKSVITLCRKYNGRVEVMDIHSFHGLPTTQVALRVKEIHEKFNIETIKVDDIGIGAGVLDLLKEWGLPATNFTASEKSTVAMFKNKKAQRSWQLRKLFTEKHISIPNRTELISELKKMTYEYDNGLVKVVDPEDKSPDFYDSLLMAATGLPRFAMSARLFN